MRRTIAVSVLGVALLAAGCGGDDGDGGRSKGSPGKAKALTDSAEKPSTTSLAKVCGGKIRLTKAPPYAGGGGHPAMFFRPGTGNADPATAYIYLFPRPKTIDQRPVLQPTEFGTVQLVGCLDRVSESPAGKECDFDIGAPAPLYTGRYRYTLRATKTGEVLGEMTVDSRPDCPGGANVKLGAPKVYSLPREQDYLPPAEPFLYWNGQEPRPRLAR